MTPETRGSPPDSEAVIADGAKRVFQAVHKGRGLAVIANPSGERLVRFLGATHKVEWVTKLRMDCAAECPNNATGAQPEKGWTESPGGVRLFCACSRHRSEGAAQPFSVGEMHPR